MQWASSLHLFNIQMSKTSKTKLIPQVLHEGHNNLYTSYSLIAKGILTIM